MVKMNSTKELKEIMKERGMSIKELSIRCGIARNTLYRRFEGKSFFRADEIIKIAQVLEIKNIEHVFFAK